MAEHLTSGPAAATAAVIPFALVGGVHLPIIIAAVVGAAWAASNSGKLESTFRGVITTFVSFALALTLGVILGFIADVLFCKEVTQIDYGFFGALVAVISSALSQTVILPGIAERLGAEIKTRVL